MLHIKFMRHYDYTHANYYKSRNIETYVGLTPWGRIGLQFLGKVLSTFMVP